MRAIIKKNINGWIIVDKQAGITSRQVVTKISKILNLKKVGHGGTLDPLATGILPIAIGEATKVISLVQSKEKKYVFIFVSDEQCVFFARARSKRKSVFLGGHERAARSKVLCSRAKH